MRKNGGLSGGCLSSLLAHPTLHLPLHLHQATFPIVPLIAELALLDPVGSNPLLGPALFTALLPRQTQNEMNA